ncbi:MAG: alpha/beta fold hydrolase, partial [Candidatus Dormibacteraeota bacterium]|nr:alpha/beta fold hydrolase [Candidatus Dormibacteraeota bacterium]
MLVHAARVLAVVVAMWLAASWTAERVTVHPRRWSDGPTPAQRGWSYRDVSFRDGAGLTLRGWWIPGTRHQTVVMVHGWTSSRQEPMGKSGYLHDAGYNLLLFDLRGHGTSDGDYTTLGWAEPDDVTSAVRLAHRLDRGPVALLGYSMGASAALEAAARGADVRAVVEDSGFAVLTDVIRAGFSRFTGLPADPFVYPMLGIGQVDLGVDAGRIRPVDDAARLKKPLLAIVGTADRTVPPEEGYALYQAARGPKQLLVIPGAVHVGGYYREPGLYRDTVLAFLAA